MSGPCDHTLDEQDAAAMSGWCALCLKTRLAELEAALRKVAQGAGEAWRRIAEKALEGIEE